MKGKMSEKAEEMPRGDTRGEEMAWGEGIGCLRRRRGKKMTRRGILVGRRTILWEGKRTCL